MDESGIAYNIPSVWQLEGEIDEEKFAVVFQRLVQRHENLRTSFHLVNSEPVQRVHEETHKIQITKSHQDLQDYGDAPEIQAKVFGSPEPFFQKGFWPPEAIIKDFIRPFDLSKAPLLRVGFIERTGTENRHGHAILVIDMHHIISDGVSSGILVNEFTNLYSGMNLPGLRLHYKDFGQWHNRQAQRVFIKQQEAYWLKQFSGEIPVLDLPTDYPRPALQDFAGSALSFDISQEETAVLKSLAGEEDVTLFMLLLCAYSVFLAKLSGQEDIVVGSPIAGRRHTDLQNVMGMFVNTLALRNFPVGEKTAAGFLREIKANTIKRSTNHHRNQFVFSCHGNFLE